MSAPTQTLWVLERAVTMPAVAVVRRQDSGVVTVIDRRLLHTLAVDRGQAMDNATLGAIAAAAVTEAASVLVARGHRCDAFACATPTRWSAVDVGRGDAFAAAVAAWSAYASEHRLAPPSTLSEAAARALGWHDGADAVHLGVGVAAGLVVVAGEVLTNRDGEPLDPNDAIDAATLAAPWPDAIDGPAMADALAMADLGRGRGGVFDAVADVGAFVARVDRADDNAIAVVQRLIDGLGGLIGGLINTFDVGVLALHIDDDALAGLLIGPSAALRWGVDGEALALHDCGPLATAVARHSFRSLRADVVVRRCSRDADAISRGVGVALRV